MVRKGKTLPLKAVNCLTLMRSFICATNNPSADHYLELTKYLLTQFSGTIQ